VKKFEESFLFNILKQPFPPGFCLTKAACLKPMLVQKKWSWPRGCLQYCFHQSGATRFPGQPQPAVALSLPFCHLVVQNRIFILAARDGELTEIVVYDGPFALPLPGSAGLVFLGFPEMFHLAAEHLVCQNSWKN
jgi:hypothetical protein